MIYVVDVQVSTKRVVRGVFLRNDWYASLIGLGGGGCAMLLYFQLRREYQVLWISINDQNIDNDEEIMLYQQ